MGASDSTRVSVALASLAIFGAGCVVIVGDYQVAGDSGAGGAGGGGTSGGGPEGGAATCGADPPASLSLVRGYGQSGGFLHGGAITLDPDGHTIIAGTVVTESPAFGGMSAPLPDGQGGIFVAGLNPDGTPVFVSAYPATDDPVLLTIGSVAAVDDEASGARAIYLSGSFYGSVTFGETTITSSGNSDFFVARLDASGTPIWARSFGGGGFEQAGRIAVDARGDLVGAFRGEGAFAMGAGCPAPTDADAGILAFALSADDGECTWVKKHGAGFSNDVVAFAYDRSRDVAYLGAGTRGDPYFGTTDAQFEAVVYAFSGSNGDPVWPQAVRFGPPALESERTERFIRALAVGPCGDVYAAGQYQTSIVVGNDTFTNANEGNGAERQLFLVKLSQEDGALRWSTGLSHEGTELGFALAAGPGGLLALAGEAFDASGSPGLDFGGGPMPPTSDNPSASDAYVATFIDGEMGPSFLFADRLTDHGANQGSQRSTDVVTRATGDVLVTGSLDLSIQFSPQAGDSVDGFSYGAFVAEYGPP